MCGVRQNDVRQIVGVHGDRTEAVTKTRLMTVDKTYPSHPLGGQIRPRAALNSGFEGSDPPEARP